MKAKRTPAPQRAGTTTDISDVELAQLMFELRAMNPEGYAALICLARAAVEKKSTKDLTKRQR